MKKHGLIDEWSSYLFSEVIFIYLKYDLVTEYVQSCRSESLGISSGSADLLVEVWGAVDVAQVGRVGEGVSAGTRARVETVVWGPSAAAPGNWSTVAAINMWENIPVGSSTSWPSLQVNSSGGSNKSKEFHFLLIYYNKINNYRLKPRWPQKNLLH